ncbi:MAG TPA: response regulator [Arachnia sp.]|jgi:DNA-binding response OmpR family regulator|nr:response regulator transcription factor [Propionibacteriaceae bacterium]HOA27691.1 response regulator [Arachnia sp.]HQD22365.1 response regulator [Arachnia sp.]
MSDTPAKVLVYSDDRTVRDQVRLALGKRVAADLPEIEVFEVATQAAVLRTLDAGTDYALLILDGNAQPSGGFGVAHQIKEEYADSAPVLLLVSREADAWLASWSRAEAVVGFPVDPVTLPTQVATLIRARLAQPAAQ